MDSEASSTALPLCDPKKLPNCTSLGFPICERWVISRVPTAWGCYEKQVSSEMAPVTQTVLGCVLVPTVQLGGDAWKERNASQYTGLCAEVAGMAY